MAKVKLYYDQGPGKGLAYNFMCPACGERHAFWERNNDGTPGWSWNRDFNKPTVHPSVKVTTEFPDRTDCCHSFITNGRIQYLEDCTHAMAGKTVDLPELED